MQSRYSTGEGQAEHLRPRAEGLHGKMRESTIKKAECGLGWTVTVQGRLGPEKTGQISMLASLL